MAMTARLIAACDKITPGAAGRGVVLRGYFFDIIARWTVESHCAGVQYIRSGGILLAGIVVGVEVIAVAASAASARRTAAIARTTAGIGGWSRGRKCVFCTVHFRTAHHTGLDLDTGGGSGGLLNNLPISGLVVNCGKHFCFNFATVLAGAGFLTITLTSWLNRSFPGSVYKIMVGCTLSSATPGTSFRCGAGSIHPLMSERSRIRVPFFPAYRTVFRLCAGSVHPFVGNVAATGLATTGAGSKSCTGRALVIMPERITFGFLATATDSWFCAGGSGPLVFMGA